jgi:hypothetical protein
VEISAAEPLEFMERWRLGAAAPPAGGEHKGRRLVSRLRHQPDRKTVKPFASYLVSK